MVHDLSIMFDAPTPEQRPPRWALQGAAAGKAIPTRLLMLETIHTPLNCRSFDEVVAFLREFLARVPQAPPAENGTIIKRLIIDCDITLLHRVPCGRWHMLDAQLIQLTKAKIELNVNTRGQVLKDAKIAFVLPRCFNADKVEY
ncbi:hypothetical protein HGRIS_006612 [Hohenbuehelia grisea]|uniref:Uncharacterized protein n=1 Tax=Hohenbuehelia grisea TaxID=104357 RepID=A0ABR3J9S5_9AGAR